MDVNVGWEIGAINHLIARNHAKNEFLAYYDKLTGTHGYIVGYIARKLEDGDVFQRDIEQDFEIRRSTATQTLKLMERNGLIVRESVEYDGRLKRIKLTEKSEKMLGEVFAEVDALEKKMVRDIPADELEAFMKTLDKIKKNLIESK